MIFLKSELLTPISVNFCKFAKNYNEWSKTPWGLRSMHISLFLKHIIIHRNFNIYSHAFL